VVNRERVKTLSFCVEVKMKLAKMDRTPARNVRDLERKYMFGKRFDDVKKEAEEAKVETKLLAQKIQDLENQVNGNT
jgi:hypothetical protein